VDDVAITIARTRKTNGTEMSSVDGRIVQIVRTDREAMEVERAPTDRSRNGENASDPKD